MRSMTLRVIKLLMSVVLVITTMSSFLRFMPSISTTTLALIYDEFASVLACDLEEPIINDLSEVHQLTIKVPSTKTKEKIENYSNCLGIKEVYEVNSFSISLIPVDPYYTQGDQWNLTNIQLPQAWELSTGSADVIVAVIDTGVSCTNNLTDFGSDGLLLGASIIEGITREDTSACQYSYDGGSHGTAVSSLISANMNTTGITGVAPGVKILPIKVFKDAPNVGDTVYAEGTDIAAAIVWATNHGADIINLSLGGSPDSSTEAAVTYAYNHGVILVAASGNDSKHSSGIYFDVSYPAAYPEVIAVGSLKTDGTVSNFTNIEGTGLDLSAYGENILLPWIGLNSFYYLNGTSFSSPTVAGILALMKSLYPSLSPSEAKAILLSAVTDFNPSNLTPGWDIKTGYGMVNAYQSLLQAQDFDTYTDTNLSKATAQFIYGHHQYASQLRPALDEDYFKFTLYETDSVNITLSTTSIHDLMFEVTNSANEILISIDNEGSSVSESTTLNNLSAGSYYIKVTDYAGRAYAGDYQIQVDYASLIKPIIAASTSDGALSNGQSTVNPVQLSITESLYHTVSVTKDDVSISVPSDLLFTEIGHYKVTVDDVLYDLVTFEFTILTTSGVQHNGAYNTNRFLSFSGTATLNGTVIPSGTTVSSEGAYTLIINNAGDIQTIDFTIDKTNPIISIQTYTSTPTYHDITVYASVNEGTLNAESTTFSENGSFVFTATDAAGNTSSQTVTITNIHKVSSVSLNKNKTFFYALGSTESLNVNVEPSDAVEKSVSYVSSDPLIVSVDEFGLLIAIAVGKASITVTSLDGNHSDQIEVEVVLSRHLNFEVLGVGGSIRGQLGETILSSDSDITAGETLQFIGEASYRYRLYQWKINGEVLLTKNINQSVLIGPSDLSLSVEFGLMGDLNLSDSVTTTDLVLLRRNLAGLNPLENKGLFNADLNSDGKLSTTDLVQLRRFLAGLE